MPSLLRRIHRRIRALVHAESVDRELSEEIRLHLDLETDDLIRTRQLEPAEARRRALVAFGGVERFREAHRDARGARWLRELAQDARFAARSLRRSPGFTLASVLVLALGIGAGTAMFSLADAVLFQPLPFPRVGRLVQIVEQNSPGNRWGPSVADVRGIEQWQRSLSAVGVLRTRELPVVAGGTAEQAPIGYTTSGFFRALGITPLAGRLFTSADDAPGAPPVLLVSHSFAERELGGDRAALGRVVTIDGNAHVVVGIVPAGLPPGTELWPVLQLREPARRGPFGLFVVGRLADGTTLDGARRDLAAVSTRIFPQWEASFQDRTARLTPVSLRAVLLDDAPQSVTLLAGAVLLVLLVAIANVASLMLVRATGRGREISLRAALGATRGRLLRLLLTESLVLAAAGALLGVVLGALGLRAYLAIGPGLPRMTGAHLDGRAVLVAAGLAAVAAAVVGVYPALVLARREAGRDLHTGNRAMAAGRGLRAVRGAFVVAEFALALPLLTAAGLLLNSFLRLQQADPGFDPARVLSVPVSLPSGGYASDRAVGAFWDRALFRVRDTPGVAGAAFADAVPPDSRPFLDENNFDLVDRPVPPGTAQPTAPWVLSSPGFLSVLGVPLLEGREFVPGDTVDDGTTQTPLLVSRAWASHYFPAGDAIGRRLISGGCTSCPPGVVIGIVGNVKYKGLEGTGEAVYQAVALGTARRAVLFVRTSGPAAGMLPRIVEALRALDPAIPFREAATLEARVEAATIQPRHFTSLLGTFALAAVVLASVGVFGLLAYTVNASRREIGVRLALGARPGAEVIRILRHGMGHALAGAAIGLAIALAATRGLSDHLYTVGTTDPATLVESTVLLLAVACLACWLPARRAASVDPARALRDE